MYKVTVATVVRNDREGFLTTAKSIFSQTYDNIEWVVVDGLSNDGTSEIVKRLLHRIDHCVIEKDSGIYNAMNKAIKLTTGEWLIFLNAGDTFYTGDTISELVESLLSDDEVIYGNAIEYETGRMKFYRPEEDYWLGMVNDHQATMTRTSLYRKYGYDESYQIAGDFDFFSKLRVNQHKFRKIPWLVTTVKPFSQGASAVGFKGRFNERVRVLSKYFDNYDWKERLSVEINNELQSSNITYEQATELSGSINMSLKKY